MISQEQNSPTAPKGTIDAGPSVSPIKLDSTSEPNPTEGSEEFVPSNPSKRPMSPDDSKGSEPSMPQPSSQYIASDEEEEEEEKKEEEEEEEEEDDDDEEDDDEDDEDDDEESTEHASSGTPRVILAVCGRKEAVHFDSIYDSLAKFAYVKTIATEPAYLFIDKAAGIGRIPVYTDRHDFEQWQRKGDPVLHTTVVEWADAMVIAPLSVSTLGKIAMGLCDNFLTNIVLAWDYRKPLYLVPAMDKNMWNHVVTRHQVKVMHNLGASFITPNGTCVCKGKFGDGSMVDPSDVGDFVSISIFEKKRNCGCPWIQ